MLCLLGLVGCRIPPVDTTFISTTPADAKSFAVAKQAVRACRSFTNRERSFRQAGFGYSTQPVVLRNGREAFRVVVSPPNDAVSVLIDGRTCYVGLENMTPSQSYELAQIWVHAYSAQPNSAYGDGLSDHVSGAWRNFFTEPARFPDKAPYYHRIYIAAYKTWPHGPYDPQGNIAYNVGDVFPKNTPGAAVELTHAIDCKPIVSTGPQSGAFLPCSGPAFRPK
ncbi:hypothetical protein [Jannaschia sp. AI_61]|nr:hypothetical protein [Jannaschia sp. AI_61]